MKQSTKTVLLSASLILLICLICILLCSNNHTVSFFDIAAIVISLAMILFLVVCMFCCITLGCRLPANLFRFIQNRTNPQNAQPLRPIRRTLAVLGITIAAILALNFLGNAILSLEPDNPAEYGSFTSKTTISSDGRYTAKQVVTRPMGYKVKMVRVDVYDNDTGELADSFITDRAWDFWGICWEEGSYNIWIQSGDIGVYCFQEIDGKWIANHDMPQPESIVSKYD